MTAYVTVDAQGYVTWVNGANAADFAKLALDYAKANQIGAEKTVTAEKDGAIAFEKLTLGYYLMDSSLGTLCSLDSTNSYVDIYEKNSVPTVIKEVMEDSTSQFGESNTVDIGQISDFRTTVTIPANYTSNDSYDDAEATKGKSGIQNLVVHDEMNSVLILNTEKYLVQVDGALIKAGEDYTFEAVELSGDCTGFTVTFDQDYLDTLSADEHVIEIFYSATMSTEATANSTYTNTTWITYGDGSRSEKDFTTTQTFAFDLVKTTVDGTVLEGAQFELYTNNEDNDKVALVKIADGEYRVATYEEKTAEKFESAIIEAGKANIKGLDTDDYYLEEVEAPNGYNKLPARVEIIIDDDSIVAEDANGNGKYLAEEGDSGVLVINKTGTELPSTGGVGTTIFYVIGGVLMAGAAVLLVTKKKLANEQ